MTDTKVKFTRHYQTWNAGETAVFPDHIAIGMEKAGVCTIPAPSRAEIARKLSEPKGSAPEIVTK